LCSFFNYELPEEKIAQRHAAYFGNRDDSRLLTLGWCKGKYFIEDFLFKNMPSLLDEGDILVLNNSKVINARFFARVSGDSEVEILLIEPESESLEGEGSLWKAMARPMKKLKNGSGFKLSPHLFAEVIGRTEEERFVRLRLSIIDTADPSLTIDHFIEQEGNAPIPPYIRQGRSDDSDKEVYQTTFAEEKGSVAAPTAGLHFTSSILEQLKDNGVLIEYLTLHVGPGSFLPVKEDVSSHEVFRERFKVSDELWQSLMSAKARKKRVIAVGTTVVRALEAIGRSPDPLSLLNRWQETDLFIKPGEKFSTVDAMFTNFHQPNSTHLLLVGAFIGNSAIKKVYEHALSNGYRFLSYGDTSFLVKKSDD
jgi:S-adenosylmethionine:tRNA ribosyltransferase-isomerase